MASSRSLNFSAGLQDFVDSFQAPIASPHKPSNGSFKPTLDLDVQECYEQLKNSTRDGGEDAVMREALDLYCSLMASPPTPFRAASQDFTPKNVDSEGEYSSTSILSGYIVSSPSPRSTNFSPRPSKYYSPTYARQLAYNVPKTPLSACEHGTTDIEELHDTFVPHSGSSLVSKPRLISQHSIFPVCSTPSILESDLSHTDDDDDDPFARSPGVSRAATPLNLQQPNSSKSVSTITPCFVNDHSLSDSVDIDSPAGHVPQFRVRPEKSNIVFTRAVRNSKASSEASHMTTPDFGHKPPDFKNLPCHKISSSYGSAFSFMEAHEPPLSAASHHCGQTIIPKAPGNLQQAGTSGSGRNFEYHRARTVSAVNLRRYDNGERSTSIPSSRPTLESKPGARRPTLANSSKKTKADYVLPEAQEWNQQFPDNLSEVKVLQAESEELAKRSFKAIRRDGKSLWKTFKRRTSRLSADQAAEVFDPIPDHPANRSGRTTSGNGH